MAPTKTFEVIAVVGPSGADRATARLHAVDGLDAGEQAKKLLAGFRRVWEVRELPTPRGTGNGGTLEQHPDTHTTVWTGHADVSIGPGRYTGQLSRVTVDAVRDVRVDILGDETFAFTAPDSAEDEAHVLRAAVRAMGRRLDFLEAEAVASLVLQTQVMNALADALLLADRLDESEAEGLISLGYDGENPCVRAAVARVMKAAGKVPKSPETRVLTGEASVERDAQDEDEGRPKPLPVHVAKIGADATLCRKALPITDEGATRLRWTNEPRETTCQDCIDRFVDLEPTPTGSAS